MGYDHFEYAMEDGLAVVAFFLIYMLVMGGLAIAMYVLRSLGIYTIAKRRGINHPWFAWVPVVDGYLLGCISDQFRYVVKGQVKNKRKVLLGVNIALAVVYVVFFVLYIIVIANVAGAALSPNVVTEAEMMEAMLPSLMAMLAVTLVMLVVSIVMVVFRYMALYDLYTSCSPQNNVLFLVLGIFFTVTEPFFIFFSRKKDGGMPPRKGDLQPEAVPQIAPEVDPWDRPGNE